MAFFYEGEQWGTQQRKTSFNTYLFTVRNQQIK